MATIEIDGSKPQRLARLHLLPNNLMRIKKKFRLIIE